MKEDAPILLLIISTSFGEVDWILPVLSAFHNKNPNWRIITLFGHQIVYQGLQENKFLAAEFSKISSLNIVPQEIEDLFANNISAEQVKIILKDFNKDEFAPYKAQLASICPNALLVNYPHSNYIYSNRFSEPLQNCSTPDNYSKHDIFLLNSEHDIPHWSKLIDSRKIQCLGFPVFDQWWQEKLLQEQNFLHSPEYEMADKAAKVFFHVSRHPHPLYLDEIDYQYLIKSLAEEVFSYNDSILLIKRHPRQDIRWFNETMKAYDHKRWMFSNLHLTQLCHLSDVVISFWSSGILNALAADKPVIEYYKFSRNNPDWRQLPDGKKTSIYRELCLAAPADNAEELHTRIGSALARQDTIWKQQRSAFALHCQVNKAPATTIADFLIKAVLNKAEITHACEEKQNEDTIVKSRLSKVQELVNNEQKEEAKQILETLLYTFPNSPIVLNNMGIFLFNIGEFSRSIDNLNKAINIAPDYVDGAVNIINVLLELDHPAKAAEVAVSFYSNKVNANTRDSFMLALKEQLSETQFTDIQTRIIAYLEE